MDDTSLFPPPLPNGASASALERTASLLARQLAMAKLTGMTPPAAPATLLSADEALPTLDELQARAHRKFAAGAGGGAGLARSGTLHAPPLPSAVPAVEGPFRRNNTVTGVGTASLPSAPPPVQTEQGDERAAARVNLMRKLSARRGSVSALDWQADGGAQMPSEVWVSSFWRGDGVRPP
ncbi:hypothetical protein JCM10450v2_005203 [Rhodotorula kratochvilovae]